MYRSSRPGSRVYPGGITSQPLSPFGFGIYLGLTHKSVPEWLKPCTFNKVPEQSRDKLNTFSPSEKRKRWNLVQGCECCNQRFALSELEGHHKMPRAAGGKTVPSNMALVCQSCHNHLSIIRRSVDPKSEATAGTKTVASYEKLASKGGFRMFLSPKH